MNHKVYKATKTIKENPFEIILAYAIENLKVESNQNPDNLVFKSSLNYNKALEITGLLKLDELVDIPLRELCLNSGIILYIDYDEDMHPSFEFATNFEQLQDLTIPIKEKVLQKTLQRTIYSEKNIRKYDLNKENY